MNTQNRDRFKRACCIRRSRFQLLLLSTAVMFNNGTTVLFASESVEQRDTSQTAQLGTTPVLKSVGIRFVQESKPVSAVESTSVKTVPAVPDLTNVKTEPSPALPPMVLSRSSPAEEKARELPKVILNSLPSIPTIKMPPLMAASETNSPEPALNQVTGVKMELASISKSLDKPEGLEVPLVASAKDQEEIKSSELPTDQADVRELSLAPPSTLSTLPSLPTPTTLEPPKPQLPAAVKSPLLAGKKSVDEGSRAPNVVRIPSMTLGSKSREAAEIASSEAADKSISSIKPVEPEIPSLPQQTEIANSIAATVPKLPTPAKPRELIATETSSTLNDAPAIPSSPAALSTLPPTVVAIPVSARSIETDRSVASGLGTPPNAPSQSDQDQSVDVPSSSVQLTYRDVQNITIPGVIERVAVDDESICKAMLADSNGLLLLGVGHGKTTVKVWVADKNSSGQRLQQIDVSVREAWETRASQNVASFTEATQSIAELFPTARIALRSNDNGSLTIFGRADSDEQAKQIASLVRKMFLVPVQDRIATAPPK
jgi:Pilus formation protein N terminal region